MIARPEDSDNSKTGVERWEGLTPVVEDWHTKMCLLEVCYNKSHMPVIYLIHNYVFRAQCEAGEVGCSERSPFRWLKQHCLKHATCPHLTDYCNTCKQTDRGR